MKKGIIRIHKNGSPYLSDLKKMLIVLKKSVVDIDWKLLGHGQLGKLIKWEKETWEREANNE